MVTQYLILSHETTSLTNQNQAQFKEGDKNSYTVTTVFEEDSLS